MSNSKPEVAYPVMEEIRVGMEPMEVTTRAYEVIERPVKSMGNSGGIYLPKDWIGKRVKILLIEPL